ncbi:glycosyltransferase family 2 protein [Mucilaginibacter terrenus]|uniref:Glycosyltransferase family 2 protein n=1 Tax=Mucilaginibacter terrenus TaxID=2482727 RepID=A0A3E2NMK6_9SPHI|nr:glycosyltransferase family 2 protein [Mucilaginibacter terrenus]RFZ82236.1 glycosyltransferase family 2 protein [Mucilaginibacter terrenus]
MSEPKVSIIIPAYNAAEYLRETIESALAQTWLNKEVIVVDNNSADDTYNVAASFGSAIQLLKEVNPGASFARNKGLSVATGDYLQFLDADDLLADNKIELQVNSIGHLRGIIAYGKHVNFFDDSDKNTNMPESYLSADYPNGTTLLYDLYGGNDSMLAGGMIPQHSWLVPRSVVDDAGLWNTMLTVDDDGEFFCRVVLRSSGMKYVQDSVCYYRRHKHQNNLSAQKQSAALHSAFRSIQLKEQHIKDPSIDKLLANQAMHLLSNAYPAHPQLCSEIEQFIKERGGATWLPYQEGLHKQLRKLFGWKAVRLLSYYKNGGHKNEL